MKVWTRTIILSLPAWKLYVQYKDYNWMMSFTEKLLERICIAVNGSTDSIIDGKTISFKAPYRRLPILEAN